MSKQTGEHLDNKILFNDMKLGIIILRGNLNSYYEVNETSLKKLYTARSQLYDIREKTEL